jgi:histidine triad (HIT) family protein
MGCLFCKIVLREIPSQIVFENDHALAFKDLNPAAPSHVLVIPKKHMAAIRDAAPEDAETLGQVLLAARQVAEDLGVGESGYRIVVNQGANAGQSVLHLHVHVLGGRGLSWPPG